jgi:hypothetical protein
MSHDTRGYPLTGRELDKPTVITFGPLDGPICLSGNGGEVGDVPSFSSRGKSRWKQEVKRSTLPSGPEMSGSHGFNVLSGGVP